VPVAPPAPGLLPLAARRQAILGSPESSPQGTLRLARAGMAWILGFTAKGDTLYAIALARPEDGKLMIKSLASGSELTQREIKTVQMLGSKARVKWTRSPEGLTVELPNEKPSGYPVALKIFPVDRATGQAD